MRFRLTVLLLGAVLLRGGFQAAVAIPPFGVYEGASYSPTITILEDNANRVRFQLDMTNLPGNSINFLQRLPGLWENMNSSFSDGHLLPRFAIWVALPNTGNPSLVIQSWDMTSRAVSPPTNLGENTPGQARVIVGAPGIMGGVRLVPVIIKPIVYTNSAAQCSVMTSATISIEVDDQQGTNPVTNPPTAFSAAWQSVFRTLVTNWQWIQNINVSAASHILMIVPHQYLSNVAPFVQWKEQRGIVVTVIDKNDINGGSPTDAQLRARIASEVQASSPRIDYSIFVGDETQLPAHLTYTPDPNSRFSSGSGGNPDPGNYTNENYFAAIEGSDDFPDLFHGRWIIFGAGDLDKIVSREINWERNPFMGGDSLRFERAIIAWDDQDPSQSATKRRTAQLLNSVGLNNVDSTHGWNGGPAMSNAINQGRLFVNYRGQGWYNWWYGIDWTTTDIQNLTNTYKLPIVTGIGCGGGMFGGEQAPGQGQGFGEMFMLQGTLASPRGCVAFIGPCWNTHTVYNDDLDSSLYRAWTEYGIHAVQPGLASGKMMVWAMMSDFLDEQPVLEITNTLMRQYHVEADPSLQVYTDTPQRINVSMPDALPNGTNVSFTVTVDNMNQVAADSVEVSAWTGNGQFVTGWIPQGSSSANLVVNTATADTLIVTLTGDNVLAFRQTITIGPSGPYISHVASVISDANGGNGNGLIEPGETINWSEVVQNIGAVDATDVTGHIATATQGVTITQPDVSFGTILMGDTVTSPSPFTFSLSPLQTVGPNLNFTMTYQMSNGPTLQAPVILHVRTPDVKLGSVQVVDNNNSFWDRDETVNLRITVADSGTANLAIATFTLTTTDTLVTILNGQATSPIIVDSTSYTFPDTSFRVRSAWVTPANHPVTFNLHVAANMGTYNFSDDVPIQLVIGQVGSSDPFADNANHYWVYDNTDTLYTQHPGFDWIEISPAIGGPGQEIPYANGNQTRYYHVPFNFSYYGTSYDTLSISTDGWVRPGRTTLSDPQNFALPDASDNVAGMLAPLWFNLWSNSGEAGEISYYYDQSTDRFVVEWHNIHHPADTLHETFQVQLLNPATYPTQSGDAVWMFLYQDLSPSATGNGGATVGIESQNQINGCTYIYHGNLGTGAAPLVNGRAIKITTEPPMVSGVEPHETLALPTSVELRANYPNPFNPETTIEFALPHADQVKLMVFDVLGRLVTTLVDGRVEAGVHQTRWRGTRDNGMSVSSGVYFYRLETGREAITHKMILLR